MKVRTKSEQRAYLDGYEMCGECIEKYLSDVGKQRLECLISSVRNAVEIEDIFTDKPEFEKVMDEIHANKGKEVVIVSNSADTVKLIIEIPKERLDSIKRFGIKQNEVCMLERALIIGTPLDDVKAEIEKLDEGITSYHNDKPWVYKSEVLEILDNIGKGE